jgi:hypothetical protein
MPNFNGLWTSRQQMQARGGNVWPSVPGAPTSPVATAGNTSASVAFTAPADTGFPAGITGYRVTSSPGGFTGTGLTSPVTVTGLTNGTAYTFTVAAQNVNGYGPESAASNSVTPVQPVYIEDIFSTYIYAGTSAVQSIVNGLNLSTSGGLIVTKSRNAANAVQWSSNVTGLGASLESNSTSTGVGLTAFNFNSNGYTINSGNTRWNFTGNTYVNWAFLKQPNFFDVVTYTGNGIAGRTVSHSLGSAPGCFIVKSTSNVSNWGVYHRSMGASASAYLESTGAFFTGVSDWNNTAPTSTNITLNDFNVNGQTYVAYLFAHNAGSFPVSGGGSTNGITCGSYVEATGPNIVNLGYEPQFLLIKKATSTSNWWLVDTTRGMTASGQNALLRADTTDVEVSSAGNWYLTSTGFGNDESPGDGSTWIYIAVRKGPMKTPTVATTVFSPYSANTPGNAVVTTSFPVDFQMQKNAGAATDTRFVDRLRGVSTTPTSPSAAFPLLISNSTAAESTGTGTTLNWNNTGFTVGNTYTGGAPTWAANFRRAPGFFDEVAYAGNGVFPTSYTHNLGVVPELMIIRGRSAANWLVYSANVGLDYYGTLNSTEQFYSGNSGLWGGTSPTSSVFSTGDGTNNSGVTYVNYLFATLSGVSKVGSYTGTGATQTIACGFAAGARFVLIKRSDSTGDWYLWDSSRGMVAGTDPSLLLNSATAQVNANSVYAITTGFQIVSTAAGINASGGTYVFLAIA